MSPGRIATLISAPLAAASIPSALAIRPAPGEDPIPFAYVLVALWVLIPPVWFWVEWVWLRGEDDPEILKHTHDLARNIWIALVAVLAIILRIKLQ